MTDSQALMVLSVVRQYLKRDYAPFAVGDYRSFRRLVRHVKAALRARGVRGDPFDLRIVTAMCMLGPATMKPAQGNTGYVYQGSGAAPPTAMRDRLCEVVTVQLAAVPLRDRLRGILEYVVAFGAGKWRTPGCGRDIWDGIWAGAVSMIALWMLPFKKACDGYLTSVIGHDYVDAIKREWPIPLWHRQECQRLAQQFVRPDQRRIKLGADDALLVAPDSSMATNITMQSRPKEPEAEVQPGAKYVFTTDRELTLTVKATGDQRVSFPAGARAPVTIPAGAKIIVTAGDGRVEVRVVRLFRARRLSSGQTVTLKGPVGLKVGSKSIKLPARGALLIKSADDGTRIRGSGNGQTGKQLACVDPWRDTVITANGPCVLTGPNPHGDPVAIPKGAHVIVRPSDDQASIDVEHVICIRKLKEGLAARLTGSAELTVWECTCGQRGCGLLHRLAGWQPLKRVRSRKPKGRAARTEKFLSLRDHIASALKGSGREGHGAAIAAGGFNAGMYCAHRTCVPIGDWRLRYVLALEG